MKVPTCFKFISCIDDNATYFNWKQYFIVHMEFWFKGKMKMVLILKNLNAYNALQCLKVHICLKFISCIDDNAAYFDWKQYFFVHMEFWLKKSENGFDTYESKCIQCLKVHTCF